MREALQKHLPEFRVNLGPGFSSCWLEGPADLDATKLVTQAEKKGVLVEAGDIFFIQDHPPKNFIRLGFASIPLERIEPGIAVLADAYRNS